MGRQSVLFFFGIRVLPVRLMDLGRIRVARMMGMNCSRSSVHSG